MKKIFPCVCFLIAACSNPKQPGNTNAARTDSLLTYLKNRVNPLLHNNQTLEAQTVLDSLKPEVDRVNSYRLTGAWLRCKSVRLQLDEHYDTAKLFALRALRLAQQNDTTQKEIIGAKIQLAEVLRLQQVYDSSLLLSREAYYLAGKYDTAGLPLICIRIAQLYNSIHDQAQRRTYLWEGYRRSTSAVHKNVLANHIADYYDQVGQTDSAIYFLKSLDKDTSFNNPYYFATRYENIGTLLLQQNKLNEGLQYQTRAFEINRTIGALDAQSYYDLAAAYGKLHRFQQTKLLLDTALVLAQQQKDLHLVAAIWKAKAANRFAQDDYLKAYQALDSAFAAYQEETDSSFTLKARELETKYAVRAKDEQIASLAFTNQASQQIRNLQSFVIAALLFAALALGIVFYQWSKRRQMKLQLHEAELEQQLLRSRMEPHFIFNTLSVLQSFIRNEPREKSLQYLSSFSRLLRLNLESSRQAWVPLKDEIDALKNYLDLEATAYEHKFGYSIEADEQLRDENVLIPPMLIQPFVENAVIHGVSKVSYNGRISVKIAKHDHSINCIIEDNGEGFKSISPATSKKPRSTEIVRQRLRLLTQKDNPAELAVINKQDINEGNGVRVSLTISLQSPARS